MSEFPPGYMGLVGAVTNFCNVRGKIAIDVELLCDIWKAHDAELHAEKPPVNQEGDRGGGASSGSGY